MTDTDKTPKREYIGNDIWVTHFPDGSADFEIACTPEEHAALEADAAKAGMTVEQLMKSRLLKDGPYFDAEPDPKLDAFIAAFQERIASIRQDCKSLQHTLQTLPHTAPRETVLAVVSFVTEQLNALTHTLLEVTRAAPDWPEITEPAAALEAEIAETMKAILETGLVAA